MEDNDRGFFVLLDMEGMRGRTHKEVNQILNKLDMKETMGEQESSERVYREREIARSEISRLKKKRIKVFMVLPCSLIVWLIYIYVSAYFGFPQYNLDAWYGGPNIALTVVVVLANIFGVVLADKAIMKIEEQIESEERVLNF